MSNLRRRHPRPRVGAARTAAAALPAVALAFAVFDSMAMLAAGSLLKTLGVLN
ncbi:hypothetical protein [Hansschlegelia plantiphila]|uniref:hypothetical protein n=1 Tax=Hansschlegelia plantiphila TaxID=374655 RepID=UPI0022F25FFC|nr:hypothetical protein [Hansschlegelia plantiphila]